MPSQLSGSLETRGELADVVRRTDRILIPMLQEQSQTARALWDAAQDQQGHDVLTLALSDPWGYAATDFSPDELTREDQLRHRFQEVIREMVMPRGAPESRETIEVRDTFVLPNQLEQFRLRLGNIPRIAEAQVQLHNQVRFLPDRPDRYLVTDFAIEVNRPFADAVRAAVRDCGLSLRVEPWLMQREGVRAALLRLVAQHRQDEQPAPDFALCFGLDDREAIHLLEVSDQAPELGTHELEGVGFSARGIVPQASRLLIYLTHPADLRLAYQHQRSHRLFHDLRHGQCDFLFPDDGGQAFRGVFPDFSR